MRGGQALLASRDDNLVPASGVRPPSTPSASRGSQSGRHRTGRRTDLAPGRGPCPAGPTATRRHQVSGFAAVSSSGNLAHAARTRQREERNTLMPQQLAHCGQLALPPNERGARQRQGWRTVRRRGGPGTSDRDWERTADDTVSPALASRGCHAGMGPRKLRQIRVTVKTSCPATCTW